VICDAWEVVVVPFPFTDRVAQKKRPALIVSRKAFNQDGQTVMGMITSSSVRWPSDCLLRDLASAGLSTPCVVRLKLFTLDNRLIIKRIGKLAEEDQERVVTALQSILPV
jgi:mRNA interferase MazF